MTTVNSFSFPNTPFIQDSADLYTLTRAISKDEIIQAAKSILNQRFFEAPFLTNTILAKDFLISQLGDLKYEVFCVAFLDTKHRVLGFDEMFRGTIDVAPIYPREIVRKALEYNAAAVVLAHNHPSGYTEPSDADKLITEQLRKTLALFDIRVLDHFIIASSRILSFAELGYL